MAQSNFIATNQELRNGEFLLSKDGNFKAIFQVSKKLVVIFDSIISLQFSIYSLLDFNQSQDDGNFVIYKWAPCWHTNTANDGGIRVLLQKDNNLAMYTKKRDCVWSTVTRNEANSDKMRLTLTNEGHLVLDKDAEAIWTSENSEGCKE